MKKFKKEDILAGGALLAVLSLFASFLVKGAHGVITMAAGWVIAAAVAGAMLCLQPKKRKAVLRSAAAVLMCVLCLGAFLISAQAAFSVSLDNFSGKGVGLTATATNTAGNSSNSSVTNAVITGGDKITIVAQGYVDSSGCSDKNAADTVTLTLTNSSAVDLTLDVAVSGTSSASNTGTGLTLASGKSFTYTVASAAGTSSKVTGYVTVTNVAVVASETPVNTHFQVRAGGTLTIDDTVIEANTTLTKNSGSTYTLVATPSEGYTVYGWMSQASGLLSNGSTYTYTAVEGNEDTIWPMFIKRGSALFYVQNASPRILYGYFDEALDAAGSSGTVVVYSSGSLYGTNGKTEFTIGTKQRLLVPFASGDTGTFKQIPKDSSTMTSTAAVSTYCTLTVPSGTRIVCDGAINVNGQRRTTGQGATGTGIPRGSHGVLHLAGTNETQLTVNGTMYAYGFVSGTGTVQMHGTLYELMQVYDWPGGTNMNNWRSCEEIVTLFFTGHYYIQNVEAPIVLHYGSHSYGEAVLTASSMEVVTSAPVVGTASEGSGLILLREGNTVTRTYDSATDRNSYVVSGSNPVDFGGVSISYSVVTLSSKKYTFPVNNTMSIRVADGATLNMSSRAAMLPGSELIVDEGGTLNLTNQVFLMDKGDIGAANEVFFAIQRGPAYTAGRKTTLKVTNPPSARVEVNGDLNITGSGGVYTTTGRGTTASSDPAKVIYGTGTINHQGSTAAATLVGGVGKTMHTFQNVVGLANLAGDGDMQSITSEVYHGLGADHGNKWYINTAEVEATCGDNAYTKYWCSDETLFYKVEKPDTATGNHTWVDATCTAAKTCSVCGAVDGEPLGHDEVVDQAVAADCANTGLTEGKHCQRCNEVTLAQEVIPALGHKYADAVFVWDEENFTTCSASVTCTVCADTMTGHTLSGQCTITPTTTEPTCATKGQTVYTATITLDKEYSDTRTKVLPEDSSKHDCSVVVTDPTCTEQGYSTYSCKNCDYTNVADYTEALGHSFTSKKSDTVATEATCVDAATYYVQCDRCTVVSDSVKVSGGEALGHIYPKPSFIWQNSNTVCVAIADCSRCANATFRENCDVTQETTAATCTEAGKTVFTAKITVSGTEYTNTKTTTIAATGHTPVTDAYKAPTCSETGLTEGSHCGICNAVLTAQETIAKLDHTEGASVKENEKAATCKAAGSYDTVVYCTVCNTELSRVTTTVDKLAHTEETVPAKAASCTETGLTEGKKCSVCGEILSAQTETAALGHTEVIDQAVAASCETTGLTEGKHCSVCNEVLVAQEEVAALGHDYEFAVTKAATCTEDGVKTYTCKNDKSHSYTETIKASGHTEVIDAAVAATCTASGLTEGKHCSVCGEILVAQTVVNALGHTAVVDAAVAPTCTNTGLTEGSHCKTCGETLVAQTVVAATGHKYASVVTKPTCTVDGYTTHTCSACGDVYTDSVVTAPGHTEKVLEAVAPGCTTTGLTEGKYCSVCNATLVAQEVVKATGHTEQIKQAVAPTCTATGLTEGKACSVCKETLVAQEVVPALGHTEETIPGTPATCTEDGLTDGVKCSVCGTVLQAQTVIPASGHAWNNGVCENDSTHECEGHVYENGICKNCKLGCSHEDKKVTGETAPTCDTVGTTTYHCDNCNLEWTETVAATGHSWADATCTVARTCSVCGKTDGDPLGHNDTTVVTAPTCTNEGYTTSTCSRCNRVEVTDKVAALGHTAGEEYELEGSRTNATCTTPGSYVMVANCTVCQKRATERTVTIPAPGHKEGSVVVENEIEANCTNTGSYDNVVRCTVCNGVLSSEKVIIPTNGEHSYGAGVVTAPTCTANGYTTYTCTLCGSSYSDSYVDATGHSETAVVTAPTCEESGYTTYTCTVCGTTRKADIVEATGHDYKSTVTAPGFGTQGFTTHTCANCGDEYVDSYTDALVAAAQIGEVKFLTLEDAIAASEEGDTIEMLMAATVEGQKEWDLTGKTLVVLAQENNFGLSVAGELKILGGTFTVMGTKGFQVTETGKLTIEGGTFSYNKEAEEPVNDCLITNIGGEITISGGKFHGQYVCLHNYSGTAAISGGTFTTEDTNSTGEYTSMDIQGNGVTVTGGSFSKNVDAFLALGYCAPDINGVYVAAAHNTVTDKGKSPTCTETGLTEGKHCDRCGTVFTAQEEISALGHSYTESVTKDASCTEAGEKSLTCTVCGDTKTEVIAATGHNWSTSVEYDWSEDYSSCTATRKCTTDSTHTQTVSAASTSYPIVASTCTVMGKACYTATFKTEGDWAKEQTEIVQNLPLAEHTWSDIYYNWAKSGDTYTCTAEKLCTVCNEKVTANGQVASVQTKAPTCIAKGLTTYTATFTETWAKKDTHKVDIPAIGHSYTSHRFEWNGFTECFLVLICENCDSDVLDHELSVRCSVSQGDTLSATCTEAGKTEYTASVTYDGQVYTDTAEETLETMGHTEAAAVTENPVAATCKAAGSYESVVYCSVCGAELSRETIAVDKLPHTEAIDAATAPTCTETGLTEGSHCSVCGEVIVAQEVVPALGHTEVIDEAVDATCTETGLTEGKHCSACGETIVAQEEIPATGHVNTTETVVDPTCNNAGSKTVTCACGHVVSKVEIPATGNHAWGEGVETKAPTTTEEGEMTYTCGTCGETKVEKIPVLEGCAHTPGEAVVENIVKGTKPQYDSVTYCTTCGEEVTRETVVLAQNVFAGMTMNLQYSLEVNFGVNTALLDGTGHYAIIRRTYSDGKEDSIVRRDQSTWNVYNGTVYSFPYDGIYGFEMVDKFYITLYNSEDEIVGVYEDSVRDYSMRMLSKTSYPVEYRRVFVDMLNYGAAAQSRFNYAVDNLANNQLQSDHKALATGNISGANNREMDSMFGGSSLMVENSIKFNFMFAKTGMKDGMYAEIAYNSTAGVVIPTKRYDYNDFWSYNNSYWCVTVEGMSITDGYQLVTCTLYNADGTVYGVMKDSMESYLVRNIQKDPVFPSILKFIDSSSKWFTK